MVSYRDEHRPTALLLHKQTLPQFALCLDQVPGSPLSLFTYCSQKRVCVCLSVCLGLCMCSRHVRAHSMPQHRLHYCWVTSYFKIHVNNSTLSPTLILIWLFRKFTLQRMFCSGHFVALNFFWTPARTECNAMQWGKWPIESWKAEHSAVLLLLTFSLQQWRTASLLQR